MTDLAIVPGIDDIGYGYRREQLLEDGIGAEIAVVRVVVPGIWCDMDDGCVNGPGCHWWEDTCCSAVLPWLPEPRDPAPG